MTAPVSDPALIPPPDGGPVLRATDIWKLFEVGDEIVYALSGVSFTARKGEFVALMGPSGSGKSTMLYLLGGLDRPTKGDISINGRPTRDLTESQFAHMRHSAIGFIFQSFNLIPFLSAVENVELPLMFEPADRASVRRRATDLLDAVGLGHRLHHRPARLSGGEQQRTAIARALVGGPQLVLADEPTASLDSETGASVTRMLKELCKDLGVTVVAATHDPAVAAQADRVLRMSDGRIDKEEQT